MPIPSSITDLSATIASNSPAGGEPPGQGDDHLRAHAGFIRQLYDAKATTADLADSTNAAKGAGLVAYRGPQSAPADSIAERLSWDVYVTDPQFNAVGDGTTDSTTQLAAAVTYVNALCDVVSDSIAVNRFPRLIFPPSLGFRSTATLAIRAGVEVVMQSPLLVVSAAGTPTIGIDMFDAKGVDFQAPRATESVFWVRRVTQSNWGTEGDIGVRIQAQYVGKTYFKRIDGFSVGVDATFAYADVRLGDFRDNKIGLKLQPRTSPSAQFANQNAIRGGSFSCGGGVGTGLARYGIKLIGTAAGLNTLLCDGQSYELNKAVAGSADSIPIWCDGSSGPIHAVRFINQRTEAIGTTVARLVGQVRNVEIGLLDGELEYVNPTSLMLDDQSTVGGGNFLYRHHGATAPQWYEFFNTGKLSERVVGLSGSFMSIINMECMTTAGAAPTPPVFSAVGGLGSFDSSGYMTASSPLYGVRVRLNGARSLAISGRKPSGQGVDLYFTCFDSAGSQITAVGAVSGEQSNATINTGVYGGLYNLGTNPANTSTSFDAVIGFTASVATVFVSVGTPVDGWVLKRIDGRPEWFSSSSHMAGQFVGASIPVALTNVTYARGMRVAQLTATVGQPKAWTCTNAATPTFVSEGNL